jgi:hypothetical protein
VQVSSGTTNLPAGQNLTNVALWGNPQYYTTTNDPVGMTIYATNNTGGGNAANTNLLIKVKNVNTGNFSRAIVVRDEDSGATTVDRFFVNVDGHIGFSGNFSCYQGELLLGPVAGYYTSIRSQGNNRVELGRANVGSTSNRRLSRLTLGLETSTNLALATHPSIQELQILQGDGNYNLTNSLAVFGNIYARSTASNNTVTVDGHNGNITSIGTNTAAYFSGNGSLLTGVNSATSTNQPEFQITNNNTFKTTTLNIDGGTSNFTFNANIASLYIACTNDISVTNITGLPSDGFARAFVVVLDGGGVQRKLTFNGAAAGTNTTLLGDLATTTPYLFTNRCFLSGWAGGSSLTNVSFGVVKK